MVCDESELYIARTPDGTILDVWDYVRGASHVDHSLGIYCPNCYDEHREQQPVTYVPEEQRFIHQTIERDCYKDRREKDRSHGFLQQMVLQQFRNNPRYSQSEIEYALRRPRRENKLKYDVAALLPEEDDLKGIVVEIQHQSGRFNQRLPDRVKIAHQYNFGFYVVFSSHARGVQTFERRFSKVKDGTIDLGGYAGNHVSLGSMIRPGDDLTALKT